MGYGKPAGGMEKQECVVFQQIPQTQSDRCLPTFSTGLSTAWATGSVDKNDRIKAMPSHGGPGASEPSIDDAGVTLPAADLRLLEPENRPGCAARQLDH